MSRNHPLEAGLCILLLLSAFSVSRSVEAGEGTFKIPDYIPQKFTDLRLQITGGASSSNRNSSIWVSEFGTSTLPEAGDAKSNSRNHYLNLGSSGQYRYETVPFRLLCGAALTTNLNSSKYNGDDHAWGKYYERRSNSDNSQHSYEVFARPFLSSIKYVLGDLFVMTDNRLGLGYSHAPGNRHDSRYDLRRAPDDSLAMEASFSLSSSQSRNRRFMFSADASLAFGLGHIYEGWYAATSLYIMDELRNRSLLESEPTIQQMKELCALVYQNALQHAIDNRIRFIESMQTILGYLEQQGMLRQGVSSALIVQDVWNYFPRTSRRFGWQVSIGSGLANDYRRDDDSSFNVSTRVNTRYLIENPSVIDTIASEHMEGVSLRDTKRRSSSAFLQIQSECHKAIDLKWQFDADVAVRYYLHPFSWATGSIEQYWHKTRTDYDDYVSLNGDAELTYIVNSRTSAALRGHLNYESYKLTVTENGELKSQKRSLDRREYEVSLRMTYRIAIPTALDISFSYGNYQLPESSSTYVSESNEEQYGATVSISHYLF
jgi:hypothetical protein